MFGNEAGCGSSDVGMYECGSIDTKVEVGVLCRVLLPWRSVRNLKLESWELATYERSKAEDGDKRIVKGLQMADGEERIQYNGRMWMV